jgi:general secretion pathway protein J
MAGEKLMARAMPSNFSARRVLGFTLLEVLVAISIFALIGIASYRVLSSVMLTDERLAQRSEELRTVNRAFWIMQQDFEQIVQRSVRDGSGVRPNWLIVDEKNPLPLQFTRGGRANPLGLPRSDMQRVAYKVDHHPDYEKEGSEHYHDERHYLLRYTWPMLDGSGDVTKALVQVLLPEVDKLTVAVQSNMGLMSQWPPPSSGGVVVNATAIRVDLQQVQWGEIQQWYQVF